MNKEKSYEYTCITCKRKLNSERIVAVCPDCVRVGLRKLTDSQYLEWLERQMGRIHDGLVLTHYDDTTIGNRELYCSWGMCNDDLAAWPDAQTWKHPGYTKPFGETVSHVQRASHQWCPLDYRRPPIGHSLMGADYGCFYRCRIFCRKLNDPKRHNAVKLFQKTISEVKNE